MRSFVITIPATAAMALALLLAGVPQAPAFAQGAAATQARPYLVRGHTADGHAFFSGGVSIADRVTMHSEQRQYGLWVATVAKPSGAYLADVRLRITDLGERKVVLDRALEGPWLMIRLPPGRYEVQGTFRAEGASRPQTLSETVMVEVGHVRQAVLRFDSNAKVAPGMESPFDGNPFGMPPISP